MRDHARSLSKFDMAVLWPDKVPAYLPQILFGLSCTLAAVLARVAVDVVAPTAGPYALFYPTTLIATLFGRWQAGLVAAAASLMWIWIYLVPHAADLSFANPADQSRMAVNVVSLVVIVVLAEVFRGTMRSALVAVEDREARLRELHATLEQKVVDRTRELAPTWTLTPDLLGVVNTEGFFEETNPAWQTTLGLSAETLRTTLFFEFVHQDDHERTSAAWDEVKRGQPVLRFENRYRHANGDWRWLSWVVVPEDGKFYTSARDITAEKDAEAGLAIAQEALRQAQKMEAIGQLTGSVAHDFNNLLTVIRGSIDMLRRPGVTEERRQRYTDAIGETADRAAELTGQLLAFARRQALRPEVFDARDSLSGVMGMIASLTGSRIDIEHDFPAGPCLVRADRSQFDTAIVNMAVNARDAMGGEGRIVITASVVCEIPAVRAHAAAAGAFVAVSIADTGQGIPEEMLGRIFEPFFTTKAEGLGTGLGLSQVIGFAKQSEGEVRVHSEVGEGTTFTLYLPQAAAEKAQAAAETVQVSAIKVRDPAASGAGVCVLVVEDNRHVGEFATGALRELGFDSILASNAGEALEKLARDCGRFHVVFSDMVMPGMSGLDLADEIRRLYPQVPVILASGYSHVLARHGSRGFELLQKPYSIEQLSLVLRRALTPHGSTAPR